jgi:hypothetical protein
MTYARGTVVRPEKSRAEIEKLVRSIGATSFVQGYEHDRAEIGFEVRGRRIRFSLRIPDRNKPERRFTHDAKGFARSPVKLCDALDAEDRRLWRALLLVIKAKIEAFESGIETFDQAFLANIVIPSSDGVTTVGEYVAPALVRAYSEGIAMPRLLAAGT